MERRQEKWLTYRKESGRNKRLWAKKGIILEFIMAVFVVFRYKHVILKEQLR